MKLIDTHAHVYLEEFGENIPNVLQNADNEGIKKILLPAIDSSTHEQMLTMESQYPNLLMSMMGVHPCSVRANFEDELKIAIDYFEKRPFVAVGEIGLDFYWDKSLIPQQYEAFNRQIDWALHWDIPIVIHSREAVDECIKVVKNRQNGKLKGVFHCFSGTTNQAQEIMDVGFYLGIGGVLTFKNSGLDKVMKQIGLDRVVLETDSPYLAPVPFRGKRNEPSYLKYVVKKLSEIKELPPGDVAKITTKNAEELFMLDDR